MEKQELLEYVRDLRSQRLESSSRRGFTAWALGAGVVYVFWHLIPQVVELAKIEDWKELFAHATAHVFLTILVACYLVTVNTTTSHKSPFDYRIYQDILHDLPPVSFLFGLAVGFPLLLSIYALSNNELTDLVHLQLVINCAVLAVFALSFLGTTILLIYSYIKTGYPHPAFVLSDGSGPVERFNVIMSFAVLEMFFGNLYAALVPILSGATHWSVIFSAAFDASIVVMAILAAVTAIRTKRDAEALTRIERDIFLHDLQKDEIRRRLEAELLGQSVGGWINGKIAAVKEKAENLSTLAMSHEKVLSEILEIDPRYQHERKARVDNYLNRLDSSMSDFVRLIMPLITWLKSASEANVLIKDRAIHQILQDSTRELGEIKMDALQATTNASNAIRDKFSSGTNFQNAPE